jgi:hypothetical protein
MPCTSPGLPNLRRQVSITDAVPVVLTFAVAAMLANQPSVLAVAEWAASVGATSAVQGRADERRSQYNARRPHRRRGEAHYAPSTPAVPVTGPLPARRPAWDSPAALSSASSNSSASEEHIQQDQTSEDRTVKSS